MINRSSSGNRLGRQALLFPLCLVLYEFSTYIGNDMIQPGMLAVVEQYNAGIEWVPTSMTAYLAGGMFLQWLLGPLSDRIGRRPVMLTGCGRRGRCCARDGLTLVLLVSRGWGGPGWSIGVGAACVPISPGG